MNKINNMIYYHAAIKTENGYLIKYTNYTDRWDLIESVEEDGEDMDVYIVITTKSEIE